MVLRKVSAKVYRRTDRRHDGRRAIALAHWNELNKSKVFQVRDWTHTVIS